MSDIKKSLFFNSINRSDDSILSERSELVALDVEQAQSDIVSEISKAIREKKGELLRLQDFGKNSKDSLTVVGDDFSATKWVEDYHKVSVELDLLTAELKIAEKNHQLFFGERAVTIGN